MNGSLFSKTMYMIGVGFKKKAAHPYKITLKLPPSLKQYAEALNLPFYMELNGTDYPMQPTSLGAVTAVQTEFY